MRKVGGVGLIVLGGVMLAVLLLTVLGYMLTEEDDPAYLLVSGLLSGGVAGALVFLGLRLLNVRG